MNVSTHFIWTTYPFSHLISIVMLFFYRVIKDVPVFFFEVVVVADVCDCLIPINVRNSWLQNAAHGQHKHTQKKHARQRQPSSPIERTAKWEISINCWAISSSRNKRNTLRDVHVKWNEEGERKKKNEMTGSECICWDHESTWKHMKRTTKTTAMESDGREKPFQEWMLCHALHNNYHASGVEYMRSFELPVSEKKMIKIEIPNSVRQNQMMVLNWDKCFAMNFGHVKCHLSFG